MPPGAAIISHMDYQFRKANAADVPAIAEIYLAGKAFLKAQGIDQWQGPYPSAQTAAEDVAAGIAYVLEDAAAHVAAVAVVSGEDPFYRTLSGKWLQDGPYATIHRMAISPAARGQGLARPLFLHCLRLAEAAGVSSVRVDTHPQNKIMQAAILRAGFTQCGMLRVYDGTRRIGYERLFTD